MQQLDRKSRQHQTSIIITDMRRILDTEQFLLTQIENSINRNYVTKLLNGNVQPLLKEIHRNSNECPTDKEELLPVKNY